MGKSTPTHETRVVHVHSSAQHARDDSLALSLDYPRAVRLVEETRNGSIARSLDRTPTKEARNSRASHVMRSARMIALKRQGVGT